MSTWTSSLWPILVLAACVPLEGGLSGASRSAPILGGAMNIGVPRGYCVDPGASQTADDSAVVIVGRCSDAGDVAPAAITTTVGAAGSAAVLAAGTPALSEYFTSADGRAALSREGDGDAVSIQEVLAGDNVILLHLTDRAVGEYWRAVMGVQGRLVTLAVTAPEGQPLTADQGRALLDQAISAMRAANPATAA
jgi:hypothetical protein